MRTVTTISMYVDILVKENKGVYNKKGIRQSWEFVWKCQEVHMGNGQGIEQGKV